MPVLQVMNAAGNTLGLFFLVCFPVIFLWVIFLAMVYNLGIQGCSKVTAHDQYALTLEVGLANTKSLSMDIGESTFKLHNNIYCLA